MTSANLGPKTGPAIGQMFFAGFGTLWMMGWCWHQHGADLATLSLISLAGGSIFLWAWCDFQAGKASNDIPMERSIVDARRRVFRRVNITQWVTIVAANVGLNAVGRGEWIAPAVILIVGVHFIPLARLFHARRHYVTGAALIAVAFMYPWLAQRDPSFATGECATGSILWISAIFGLLRARFKQVPYNLPENSVRPAAIRAQ
jgi:hypothetical protein